MVGDLYLHVEDAWAQARGLRGREGGAGRDRLVPDPAPPGARLRHRGGRPSSCGCASSDLGLRRLTAVAFADNPASLRSWRGRDAPRGAAPAGVAAPRPRLGRQRRLCLLADEWRAQQYHRSPGGVRGRAGGHPDRARPIQDRFRSHRSSTTRSSGTPGVSVAGGAETDQGAGREERRRGRLVALVLPRALQPGPVERLRSSSQVRTPKPTGVPVSSATRVRPSVAAEQT